jgi:hypothetical protein
MFGRNEQVHYSIKGVSLSILAFVMRAVQMLTFRETMIYCSCVLNAPDS